MTFLSVSADLLAQVSAYSPKLATDLIINSITMLSHIDQLKQLRTWTPVSGKSPFLDKWPECLMTYDEAIAYPGATGVGCAGRYTATLDIDDLERVLPVVKPLQSLLASDHLQIHSPKPNTAKLVFRLPDGVNILKYVNFEGILELRSGYTHQDVWGGSAYPDGGEYTCSGMLQVLPKEIFDWWQWVQLKHEEAQKRYEGKELSPWIKEGKVLSVVHAFDSIYTPQSIMDQFPELFERVRYNRYTYVHGSEKGGLVIYESNRPGGSIVRVYHNNSMQGIPEHRFMDAFELRCYVDLVLNGGTPDDAKARMTARYAKEIKLSDGQSIHQFNNPADTTPKLPTIECEPDERYTKHQWPPGFVGRVAYELFECMPYSNSEIAIIAARQLCACFIGRQYASDDRMRPELWDVVLAPSAVGKDTFRRALNHIKDRLIHGGVHHSILDRFLIDKPNGVKALHTALIKTGSCTLIFSEAGLSKSTQAGDNVSVSSYLMQNFQQDSWAKYFVQGYSDGMPPVFGTIMHKFEESTFDAYKIHLDEFQLASGETSRKAVHFIDHKPNGEAKPFVELRFSDEVIEGFKRILTAGIAGENDGARWPEETDEKPKGTSYTGLAIDYCRLRKRVDTSAVNDVFDNLYIQEFNRRKTVDNPSHDPLEWATNVRSQQAIKREAIVLGICNSLAQGAAPVVDKATVDYAIHYIREVHRAVYVNARMIYDSEDSKLLTALVNYVRSCTTDGTSHINHVNYEYVGASLHAAGYVAHYAITKAATSAVMRIAKETAAVKGGKPMDHIKAAYREGRDRGYWSIVGSGYDHCDAWNRKAVALKVTLSA